MKSLNRHRVEPCGEGCNFLRLSLDLILDGIIDEDEYFTTFLSGAKVYIMPDAETWKKKWLLIIGHLKRMSRIIKDFSIDSDLIFEEMEKGNFVMHHSRVYRELYCPHYRIFNKRRTDFSGFKLDF